VTNYERWRVGGFFWNKMGLEIHTDVDRRSPLFLSERRWLDLRRPSCHGRES
jgi:hypothetical protein